MKELEEDIDELAEAVKKMSLRLPKSPIAKPVPSIPPSPLRDANEFLKPFAHKVAMNYDGFYIVSTTKRNCYHRTDYSSNNDAKVIAQLVAEFLEDGCGVSH